MSTKNRQPSAHQKKIAEDISEHTKHFTTNDTFARMLACTSVSDSDLYEEFLAQSHDYIKGAKKPRGKRTAAVENGEEVDGEPGTAKKVGAPRKRKNATENGEVAPENGEGPPKKKREYKKKNAAASEATSSTDISHPAQQPDEEGAAQHSEEASQSNSKQPSESQPSNADTHNNGSHAASARTPKKYNTIACTTQVKDMIDRLEGEDKVECPRSLQFIKNLLAEFLSDTKTKQRFIGIASDVCDEIDEDAFLADASTKTNWVKYKAYDTYTPDSS